jgi:uncharacterized protein YdhG (YjbR/CyaY superfamily)
MTFSSHEGYFEAVAPEARWRLEAIQSRVETLLPSATRCISYNIPAFRDGPIFFYFAAFKNHIGIYPPLTQDAALVRELAPYRGTKGNLSFPLDQPLPLELVGRVAVALHRQYATAGNRPKKRRERR